MYFEVLLFFFHPLPPPAGEIGKAFSPAGGGLRGWTLQLSSGNVRRVSPAGGGLRGWTLPRWRGIKGVEKIITPQKKLNHLYNLLKT